MAEPGDEGDPDPRLRVGVFRPDDERMADAVELIDSLGATPVADPMLAVEPTGATPREDADYVLFTSKTGVELVAERDWRPDGATVAAIGESTAEALRGASYTVDLVPDTYSSTGLVDTLEGSVDGSLVEVARSDHGNATLIEGLFSAGAYVHETVLYRLVRPADAGESVELAAAGELGAALFTSSLTVEHFLDAATERGVREDAVAGLNDAVVGTIGIPTKEKAGSHGIEVDVVPERADFETLACDVIERASPTYHE